MNKKSDRPILVYRFSSLGDIAMTVPVLRSFFNSYPNQKIIFVSRPYASPLFEEFDNLESFLDHVSLATSLGLEVKNLGNFEFKVIFV